jgi:DNA-binding transcriptional LysR family regulator
MRQKHRSLPFDLHGLEIFLSVCDTGGMAAAAQELGITQPAVSFAIADLERKTGSALFDRTVRPLALTLTGSLMRQRAASLLADARQITPMLRQVKLGKVALIRVGLVDSLSRGVTLPLSSYLADHAQEVSILSGLTAAHASELLTRRLDLFLGVDDLEETSGLERWEILREPYVLCLSRRERRPRSVEDLIRLAQSRPFIRFSARSRTGVEIERHLRRLGVEAAQCFEYDSPFAVAAMVAAGHGFAISTLLCIAEAKFTNRELVTWPLPGPVVTRKLSVVARYRELGKIPRDVAEVARNAFTPEQIAIE